MGTETLILIGLIGMVALSAGSLIYLLYAGPKDSGVQGLMQASKKFESPQQVREALEADETGQEYEKLKELQRKKLKKKKDTALTLEERYFHAGIFSKQARKEFERLRIVLPAIMTPVFAGGAYFVMGKSFILSGLMIGLLGGLKLPSSILDRRIKRRGEDIMFFLPLVVEQISIGVSSSLDIGPCLQRIVQMADERDSHNVVTELIRHTEYLVKSGVSLEEALLEVGTKSGHNELKHVFMALSQVAKHGGEISRQLVELADSVSSQREAKIEEKIRKLELAATGPVALVFMGFFLILLVGFGLQIKNAF